MDKDIYNNCIGTKEQGIPFIQRHFEGDFN